MYSEEIIEILQTKSVGIAGCGGLGSNCAVALARAGIGKLIIVDFDKIEESNLNRQYFFYDQIGLPKAKTLEMIINRINPKTEVHSYEIYLDINNTFEIFKDCDIIVEAFDKIESKEMIIKVVNKYFPDKKLVMGIGISGWGHNNKISETHLDNIIICGDRISEISETCPPMAPKVGIIANMQANVALELLLK